MAMVNAALDMRHAMEALAAHPLAGVATLLAAFSLAVLSEAIGRRAEGARD